MRCPLGQGVSGGRGAGAAEREISDRDSWQHDGVAERERQPLTAHRWMGYGRMKGEGMAVDFDAARDDGERSGGGEAQLLFAGGTFRIRSWSGAHQDHGHPSWGAHSVHLIREPKAGAAAAAVVLRGRGPQRAWVWSKLSKDEVSMELVPNGSQGGGCYPLWQWWKCEQSDRQGCSLSEGTSETKVSVLRVFPQRRTRLLRGSYRLRARRTRMTGSRVASPAPSTSTCLWTRPRGRVETWPIACVLMACSRTRRARCSRMSSTLRSTERT